MEEVKQCTVYLPPKYHLALKVYAAEQGITISEVVTTLIKEFLKEQK